MDNKIKVLYSIKCELDGNGNGTDFALSVDEFSQKSIIYKFQDQQKSKSLGYDANRMEKGEYKQITFVDRALIDESSRIVGVVADMANDDPNYRWYMLFMAEDEKKPCEFTYKAHFQHVNNVPSFKDISIRPIPERFEKYIQNEVKYPVGGIFKPFEAEYDVFNKNVIISNLDILINKDYEVVERYVRNISQSKADANVKIERAFINISNEEKPVLEAINFNVDGERKSINCVSHTISKYKKFTSMPGAAFKPWYAMTVRDSINSFISSNKDTFERLDKESKDRDIESFKKRISSDIKDISFRNNIGVISSLMNLEIFTIDNHHVIFNDSLESYDYDADYGRIKERIEEIGIEKSLTENLREIVSEFEKTYDEGSIFEVKSHLLNCLSLEETLSDSEKNHKVYLACKEKANEYLSSINKNKSFLYLESIRDKINCLINKENDADIENEIVEIQDMVDGLNDKDVALIRYDLDLLYKNIIKRQTSEEILPDVRRVFIHKNAYKLYKGFKKEVRSAIDEIVLNMKTMNGLDLQRYFLEKLKMNAPYDHMNFKVRVKNINPYRICFWWGRDFSDRSETKNDIYIYFFISSDHDEDIKAMKDMKPDKYHEYDFTLFNSRESDDLVQPELNSSQFRLSSSLGGPKVIYGCAGSGKTLVSLDQYYQIVRRTYKDKEVPQDFIAYVTFQTSLKKKAASYLENYGVKDYCYTLIDFFKHVGNTKDETHRTINEKDFMSWFDETYSDDSKDRYTVKRDIKSLENKVDLKRFIYTYYRGLYKGSQLLYDDIVRRKKDSKGSDFKWKNHLTLQEFRESMRDEEYLSDSEKQGIYNVCERYHEYAISNKMYDDNDFALEALKNILTGNSRRVENIVIDEVQDLTSLQLHAIMSSLKDRSKNIFFYGDPHQTVNPTVFNDSTLKNAVYKVFGKGVELKRSNELSVIHRTNENLKNYLVYLQEKRIEWLRNYMNDIAVIVKNVNEMDETIKANASFISDESETSSTSQSDNWASYIIGNTELERKVFDYAIKSMAVIIVPDEKTRDGLIKANPSIPKDRIFTIFEAKGMEWKKVILYDMVSVAKEYFQNMIDGKSQRSTISRMFFNKYYVACTRAKETFIIIENDITDSIRDNLFKGLPELKDFDQAKLYFDGSATYSDWLNEADRLIRAQMYDQARYAVVMALNSADNLKDRRTAGRLARICYSEKATVEENFKNGLEAIGEKNYTSAELFFLNAKKYDHMNLAKVFMREQIDTRKHYLEFLQSGLLEEYEEAYAFLPYQRFFKESLISVYNRMIDKSKEQ